MLREDDEARRQRDALPVRDALAVRVELRARPSAPVCAICRDGDDLTVCHRCGVTTHLECSVDARRCPTIGCVEPPARLDSLLSAYEAGVRNAEARRRETEREEALERARAQYRAIVEAPRSPPAHAPCDGKGCAARTGLEGAQRRRTKRRLARYAVNAALVIAGWVSLVLVVRLLVGAGW